MGPEGQWQYEGPDGLGGGKQVGGGVGAAVANAGVVVTLAPDVPGGSEVAEGLLAAGVEAVLVPAAVDAAPVEADNEDGSGVITDPGSPTCTAWGAVL